MANQFNQNLVFNDLGTFTLLPSAPFAGQFSFDAKLTIPTLTNGGGVSSCLATVKKNGSTIYTGNAGDEGFYLAPILAAGDAITVVLSSSAAADQPINVIKMNCAVSFI